MAISTTDLLRVYKFSNNFDDDSGSAVAGDFVTNNSGVAPSSVGTFDSGSYPSPGADYSFDFGSNFHTNNYLQATTSMGNPTVGTVSHWSYVESGTDTRWPLWFINNDTNQTWFVCGSGYRTGHWAGDKNYAFVELRLNTGSPGSTYYAVWTDDIPDNQWVNFIYTMNGSSTSIYVNGVSKSLNTGHGSDSGDFLGSVGGPELCTAENTWQGSYRRIRSRFSLWKMDEIYIWGRVLAADEIADLQTQTYDPSSSSFVEPGGGGGVSGYLSLNSKYW